MAPQTPLLLVDNVFDTINLYPAGSLVTSNERTGHEGFRVADYRRERSSWQTATTATNQYIRVDLGVGVTRKVDSLYLDRGHNLWSTSVGVYYSDDDVTYFTHQALTIPAVGTLGGDPTSGTMSVTEEGACYALFAAPAAAHRYWRFLVVTSAAPVVPGLILGLRTQFLGYSTVFDEDAGERTESSATSTAGYRGSDTTYSWRTAELGLAYIGATEYDGAIRALRDTIFKRNQPWVLAMDYGTRPERAWMFQYDGKTWAMKKARSYRAGSIRGREVGASLS